MGKSYFLRKGRTRYDVEITISKPIRQPIPTETERSTGVYDKSAPWFGIIITKRATIATRAIFMILKKRQTRIVITIPIMMTKKESP